MNNEKEGKGPFFTIRHPLYSSRLFAGLGWVIIYPQSLALSALDRGIFLFLIQSG